MRFFSGKLRSCFIQYLAGSCPLTFLFFYPTYFVAWEGEESWKMLLTWRVATSCELYELFSLQEAIDKLARQRTSLIIAHRLSTIVR
jgi:hypothetical protein